LAFTNAFVPLDVVRMSVLFLTTFFVYSPGEFPRSKPFTVKPERSPQMKRSLFGYSLAHSNASSTVATGIIVLQLFSIAVTIVVVALKISITTAMEFFKRTSLILSYG
jgi:hypothetical protein